MLQGAAVQIHSDHVAAGGFQGFLDGGRHFTGLATAKAHAAIAITHDGQCGEGENPTTFHDFGHAIHSDQLFLHAFVLFDFRHD